MLNNRRRLAGIAIALGVLSGTVAACDSPPKADAVTKAQNDRNRAVTNLRKNQPVAEMGYSPTLNTINRWAKTWGQKGKVAYVYMKKQDGTLDGYYVFDGLPVNYCVSGSPTYDIRKADLGDYYGDMQVPAPGLDGAYYGGCDASRYYGFDAVTGQYLEYTDGFVMTAMLSDQPLPLDKQPPAYGSTIADVRAAGKR